MHEPDKLEQRLSTLTLTQASDNYVSEGQALLKNSKGKTKSLWPVRLNYALGFCLLLSVAINVIQFEGSHALQTAVADQCELDSAMYLPYMSPAGTASLPAYELLESSTISTGLLC
jgi:hypothetical protein